VDQVVAVQSEASPDASRREFGATFEMLLGAGFNVVGAIPANNAAPLIGTVKMRVTGGTKIGARFDSKLAPL
jgi:hypothetical protein